mgnify:CR=1 FL=1
MRIPDAKLAEVWDRGFTVVEDFLDHETLKALTWSYLSGPHAWPRRVRCPPETWGL